MDGRKVASQAANGKEMEEKEDFLHQIRTKVSSHILYWFCIS